MGTEARIVRLRARVEELSQTARVLRERAKKCLDRIPEYQRELEQYQQAIRASPPPPSSSGVASDYLGLHHQRIEIQGITPGKVSRLLHRVRTTRERIVSTQRTARRLEDGAAKDERRAAVLRIEIDRLTDQARTTRAAARNRA